MTRRAPENPKRLRLSSLFVILALGAMGTVLGVTVVDARFTAQDHEFETRRLQESAKLRRDEIRDLNSRIGDFKRGESLREAAMGPLGMIEPSAESVGRLEVDESRVDEVRRAAREARQALIEKKQQRDRIKKEVF